MKGPDRKPIQPNEVEHYINGLFARWQEIHGKAALQLLKIAEKFTKSHMSKGTVQQLKDAASELDAWCAVHFDDTADWQRLKTYVRAQRHKARRGDKKGATGDLFYGLKPVAQSASDRLAEKAYSGSEEDFE